MPELSRREFLSSSAAVAAALGRGAFASIEGKRLGTVPFVWILWAHWWRPRRPGRYVISLRVGDPTIRTRRLDCGYYARQVDIAAV